MPGFLNFRSRNNNCARTSQTHKPDAQITPLKGAALCEQRQFHLVDSSRGFLQTRGAKGGQVCIGFCKDCGTQVLAQPKI
jgi:hypothetical protein